MAVGLATKEPVSNLEEITKYSGNGNKGLKFNRLYTEPGKDPFDYFQWETRHIITENRADPDKPVVDKYLELPKHWGTPAEMVLADKYAKSADVPKIGKETSAKQVIYRVAKTVADEGLKRGYFASQEDYQTFYDELVFILTDQRAAFNSPVWFNVGLNHIYGFKGKAGKKFAWDDKKGEAIPVNDSYERPQCSACFILKTGDDLDSIVGHQVTETSIFEDGSGTGSNFSTRRARDEPIKGGGKSSGAVSWMKGYDVWAGLIKSGGKTRRAAKMATFDVSHPDVEEVINVKKRQEEIARALDVMGFNTDWEGEVYQDILSFQNENISIRVPDDYMHAVEKDSTWDLRYITSGEIAKTVKAREILMQISDASWYSGDPGLQYDTTINLWHTTPNDGNQNSSNPCSEYLYLDDTACNLASLNLLKFRKADGSFDVLGYTHTIDIVSTAQEIFVDYSSYPTKNIAEMTHKHRTIGTGYSNLGALIMSYGLSYGSEEAQALTSVLSAILTGRVYRQSSLIAKEMGPFERFNDNKEPMLKVMNMHRDHLFKVNKNKIPHQNLLSSLFDVALDTWNETIGLGKEYGYRNAQATVIAPVGTIGLWMENETLGGEPYAIFVADKKLSGGGRIELKGLKGPELGLRMLGYSDKKIELILEYIAENNTIEGSPDIKEEHLPVFLTALKPKKAKKSLSIDDHLMIMAASQPFISGAISKTFNMPHEATREDFYNFYLKAWKLGLKAVAAYRDGSKLSQPLNVKETEEFLTDSLEKKVWGQSKEPPELGDSYKIKVKVGGKSLIIITTEYKDTLMPSEVFLHMADAGTFLEENLKQQGIDVSFQLQHGMNLKKFVEKGLGVKSAEIYGSVSGYPYINQCSSLRSLLSKIYGIEYLGMKELADMPPVKSELRINKLKRHKKFVQVYRMLNNEEFELKEDYVRDFLKSKNGNGNVNEDQVKFLLGMNNKNGNGNEHSIPSSSESNQESGISGRVCPNCSSLLIRFGGSVNCWKCTSPKCTFIEGACG